MKNRFFSLLTALVFCVIIFTACSKNNNSDSESVSVPTYSSFELDGTALDISYVNDVRYIEKEDRIFIQGCDSDGKDHLLVVSDDLTSIENSDAELGTNERIRCSDADTSGNKAVVVSDNSDNNCSLILYRDSDCKNIEIDSENTVFRDILLFDSGKAFIYGQDYENDKIIFFIFDGEKVSETKISLSPDLIESAEKVGNSVALTYYSGDSEEIGFIDIDSARVESTEKIDLSGSVSRLVSRGERLYIYNDTGIFEKFGDDIGEICSFSDMGIDGSDIEKLVPVGENSFCMFGNDSTNGSLKAYYISENNSELPDIKYITLGVAHDDRFISKKVGDYNRNHENMKVKIIDYSEYSDDSLDIPEIGEGSQLNMDIISGNAPDMIVVSGFTNADRLKQDGYLEDLYGFMDGDEEVSRETFPENILGINEINGGLPSVPVDFYIDTLVGKTELVGNKENWTVDDMISAYDNAPDGMELMQNANKKSVFENLLYCNLRNFVDYDNKKSRFDTPEMVKFLEFADRFEYIDSIGVSADRDIYERFYGMTDNKFLLKSAVIHNFTQFHELKAGIFNNEEITFVGYPSDDDSGAVFNSDRSISILRDSDNKQGCWEFVKYLLSEEVQDTVENFPVNKNSLYRQAELEVQKKDGNEMNFGDTVRNIGTMSEEDRDRYIEYLSDIKKPLLYDIDIYVICFDEVNSFIAGESSAKETAETIQSRVNIYINE